MGEIRGGILKGDLMLSKIPTEKITLLKNSRNGCSEIDLRKRESFVVLFAINVLTHDKFLMVAPKGTIVFDSVLILETDWAVI